MNNWLPTIIGVLLGVTISIHMKLNWLASGMLGAGITALLIWIGG